MDFPDIINTNFDIKGDENKFARQAIDYAVEVWYTQQAIREKMDRQMNNYNGYISQEVRKAKEKATGKQSKTAWKDLRLGYTKMKLLLGEYLMQLYNPQVASVNPEAVNRKIKRYTEMLGLSLAKESIEKVRESGMPAFDGVQIPDQNDQEFWSLKNFKLTNEIICQHIVEDKMRASGMKEQLYRDFRSVGVTSYAFGKVEKDADGRYNYRSIPVKYAMFEPVENDMFMERSPYKGEVNPMFAYEVMQRWPQLKSKIKSFDTFPRGLPENWKTSDYTRTGDRLLINTYTIQYKVLEPIIIKVENDPNLGIPRQSIISQEYYNKKKKRIDKDVELGYYRIEKVYKQVVRTMTRVGTDIYVENEKVSNQIESTNMNGKITASTDYLGFVLGELDGYTVSLQDLMTEISDMYNDVFYTIRKELKKLKGSVVFYDGGMRPASKTMTDIKHEMVEDGFVEFNSAAEYNQGKIDRNGGQLGITEQVIGRGDQIQMLVNIAYDLERTIDRITGINDDRQGLSSPTATATANQNNLQASRAMTYDMFFFMNNYTMNVLTKLIQKIKNDPDRELQRLIFSDEEIAYIQNTRDLSLDDYAAYMSDGRRENMIIDKIEQLFIPEINARNLRAKDAARFWMQDSLAAGLKVLDKAWNEVSERENRLAQIQIQKETEKMKQARQMAMEDREDRQAHEIELVDKKSQDKIQEIKAKAIADSGLKTLEAKNQERLDQNKNNL